MKIDFDKYQDTDVISYANNLIYELKFFMAGKPYTWVRLAAIAVIEVAKKSTQNKREIEFYNKAISHLDIVK